MQFFSGYSWSLHSVDFIPGEKVRGVGSLFVNGADDLRAQGELTPRSFGELATAQPEFADCAVKKVASTVFGGSASASENRRMMAAFRARPTYRALLRSGLQEYAARVIHGGTVEELPAALSRSVAGRDDAGRVRVDGRLQDLLDDHCGACHDASTKLDFSAPAFAPELLSRMLSAVATGDMPRGGALDDAAKQEVLSELVAAREASDEERLAAWRYYSGGMRALGVHVASTAMAVLEDRANVPLSKRHAPEEHYGHSTDDALVLPAARVPGPGPSDMVSQFTPGEALGLGLSALDLCKRHPRPGESLEGCVDRVSAPGGLFAEPIPGTRVPAR
jgi:hypothetical protein